MSREASIQDECKILRGFWELSMVNLKDLGRDGGAEIGRQWRGVLG